MPVFSDCSYNQKKVVRHYLIEVLVHARKKLAGFYVFHAQDLRVRLTMGFQSAWEYQLQLLPGPIFSCPEEGFMSVLDNRARQLKSEGKHSETHNFFSK